jgi:hypothetical protein
VDVMPPPGRRVAKRLHSASHTKPRPPTATGTAPGPRDAMSAGSTSMPSAEPKYMPLVKSDTARERSCGGIQLTSMEWIEGKTTPMAAPTRTRAAYSERVAAPSSGVSIEAALHSTKETLSTRSPP